MTAASFPTVTVEIALTTAPLSNSPVWVTISENLLAFSTAIGRANSAVTFDAGTCSCTFDNHDGRLDPLKTTSPLYPNFHPGKRIRISATWASNTYRLFDGFIDAIQPAYEGTGDEEVTVTATDGFKLLNLATWRPSGFPVPSELTGARVSRILGDIGWPSGYQSISGGNSLCVAIDDPTFTQSALSAIQDAEATEGGLLFMNPRDGVKFEDRYTRANLSASPFLLDDTGASAGNDYTSLTIITDESLVVNGATVQDGFGGTVSYVDATSQTNNGPREVTIQTLLQNPNDAYDRAVFTVLSSSLPGTRVDQVQLEPVYGGLSDYFTSVFAMQNDFGANLVEVVKTTPNGNYIDQTCFIERIGHDYDGDTWVVTWGLSPRIAGLTTAWFKWGSAKWGDPTNAVWAA